jgi:SOS-response transcriptional repressor LexA
LTSYAAIVIAWHRNKGLTVSRLNQFDHTVVLQSENDSYESITLGRKQKWKIVARCSGGLENPRELLSWN